MKYKQFETFKNISSTEILDKEQKLYQNTLDESILDSSLRKQIYSTEISPIKKKYILSKLNTTLKENILSPKIDTIIKDLQKTKILAKIPNLKTNPNYFGKIISIIFTIIVVICIGLIILTKQVNTYTLLLLFLVVFLTIICHCSIGQFCLLNIGNSIWTHNKFGQRCNYTKQMYFTALLSGFFVSYLIFINNMLINAIKSLKIFFKNIFKTTS